MNQLDWQFFCFCFDFVVTDRTTFDENSKARIVAFQT